MQTLSVNLGERSYPILVGSGLLADRALFDQYVPHRDLLLVSNTTVAPLYSRKLRATLEHRRVVEVDLPDGEQHKTLATASRLFDVLVANRFGRDCAVVALGGGVVGDLAGFAAACYQRGVDFVQIPTTLLAHVDSAVGGKTAVDHPGGKNLIGAFHQPQAVVADTDLLATLPPRELRAGLAEVIKYGLICDVGFLEWIEANIDALLGRDAAAMAQAIFRSCEIKAGIVGRDEREQGERALLNLGHTFGHAIESATGYVEWLHGEAVATGMLIAADMSRLLGHLSVDDVDRVRRLLVRTGLRVDAPRIGAERALGYMQIDKKVKGSRIRLILLRRIGAAFLTGDYTDDILRQTLAAHFG
jgi:3-dehydroquinate synthase